MGRISLWIGLDVGADQSTVCGTDDAGTVLIEQSVASKADAVHALLKSAKRRIQLIGLESGSSGIVLCRDLRKLGYPVAIFDARHTSKFLAIRRNKTDKNDARGLADIARLGRGSVSEVRVKSPECQRLRSMLVTRHKLVRLRVALEGAMRSLFRLNGGKLKTSSSRSALKRNVVQEIRRLRKSAKVDLAAEVEPLLALSMAMREYVECLDERLSKWAEANPICSRFLEIPGVGPITAASFYTAIDDPHRFRRNSDVGAYLGLVPIVRQSGQSVARLRISKAGDRLARTTLTTAAQIHVKHANSALATWATGLSARLGKGGVRAAVARKLAVIMLAMWKSGERYKPYHSALDANLQV